jgi:hypothetical protein
MDEFVGDNFQFPTGSAKLDKYQMFTISLGVSTLAFCQPQQSRHFMAIRKLHRVFKPELMRTDSGKQV